MKEFKKDLLKWKEYDYVIINDNLHLCYKKIMKVIKNKNKNPFDRNFIYKHVKSTRLIFVNFTNSIYFFIGIFWVSNSNLNLNF